VSGDGMDARRLGATYLGDQRTEFLVWAPKADRVSLHLTDSDRIVPLLPLDNGYYTAVADDVAQGALYKYRLDDRIERPDPASRYQPHGVHGPSAVVDDSFDSSEASAGSTAWTGLPAREYVLYELHVGTFSASGTFAGVIAQLPRLKALGVTAIELMPVAQFPGTRNWGYDGVYPYAVQHSYGGRDELKRLVADCHAQGIAVCLDVVYNHLGPEGNYLADFGPYFTSKYHTPWGHAINFDGRHSDEVRRYFIDNALEWITDYRIDALRLDAIHAIFDQSARPFLAELTDAVQAHSAELGRTVVVIGETNENKPALLQPTSVGGIGLDGQWLEDFHRALHALVTGERQSYYGDFGTLGYFAKAYEQGFVLDGQYSKYRGRRHGAPQLKPFSTDRFVVYSQNHDQTGNRACGERYTTLLDFESRKLVAASVILSPYIPLLFMGEEYGEPAPFAYFVDHGDERLLRSVRDGRLRDFQGCWMQAPPDPGAAATFEQCRLNLGLAERGEHAQCWNYYRRLIKLRRTRSSLRQTERAGATVRRFEAKNLLACRRTAEGESVLILYHFGHKPETLSTAELGLSGGWSLVLDSTDPDWGGPGSIANDELQGEVELTMSARSCLVYVSIA
jgi:maltooligosyltrehalose trehalohydrolase